MASKGRAVPERKRALWIGDAVAHTGFASVSHAVCDQLVRSWDVAMLGVNYYGDPHPYPYPIFPASIGGDIYGLGRLKDLVAMIKPEIICVINDPWIAKDYIPIAKEAGIPIVLYMPVDSPNIRNDFVIPLNEADLVIGYTQFAVDEMTRAGLKTKSKVISHGIDLGVFGPLNKKESRARIGVPDEWFIVGSINRNQPRKRIDLMVKYFADWVRDREDLQHARLYWHGALRDMGWDVLQLAHYYGVDDRMIITSPNLSAAAGVSTEVLKHIYNSFDVQVSTTLGEGWGLTQMEGAACRVPQIVPRWSALAEWMDGAAHFVDCTSIYVNTGGINTIGGVADNKQFVEALDKMYSDKTYRNQMGQRAFSLVSKPQFRWENIAEQFDRAFRELLAEKK